MDLCRPLAQQLVEHSKWRAGNIGSAGCASCQHGGENAKRAQGNMAAQVNSQTHGRNKRSAARWSAVDATPARMVPGYLTRLCG
jgi:hypothetical protein